MSKTGVLARIIETNKKDTDESLTVLRLQAKAWRITALIATADSKKGVGLARWLFFKTTPFMDGDAVRGFIEEYEPEAEKAGIKSGVFDRRDDGTAKP
jgi:hypothetical protein